MLLSTLRSRDYMPSFLESFSNTHPCSAFLPLHTFTADHNGISTIQLCNYRFDFFVALTHFEPEVDGFSNVFWRIDP
jgi:hypothetical protein